METEKRKRGKKKGSPKTGGRPKGGRNKRTMYMDRLADLGFDPFDLARQIALGRMYDEVEEVNEKTGKKKKVKIPLPWAIRQKSIHELMSYMAPKLKALEVSGVEGGPIITKVERVIVDNPKD